LLGVLVDWLDKGKAPGDLEVVEQKVEAPVLCRTARAAAVPMAGLAAFQRWRFQNRVELPVFGIRPGATD